MDRHPAGGLGLIAVFAAVAPTDVEVLCDLPGDDLVADADVVIDRGFTVAAPIEAVWPWLVQLGKNRAGWYLPGSVERFVPPSRRALRTLEPAYQQLRPGDVIPDYGGPNATFEVVSVEPPSLLVYRSQRGRMQVSWAIALTETERAVTRVQLRLRLGPVRRPRLARVGGGLLDLLTIAGMAAGLRERVAG